jgi:hypothetical protein
VASLTKAQTGFCMAETWADKYRTKYVHRDLCSSVGFPYYSMHEHFWPYSHHMLLLFTTSHSGFAQGTLWPQNLFHSTSLVTAYIAQLACTKFEIKKSEHYN